MRILLSGASGFIGGRISSYLQSLGHVVVRITRTFSYHDLYLNYEDLPQDLSPLEGFDACIHLAGENISDRWTNEKKEQIVKSRVQTTLYLSDLFTRLKNPPKVFIIASAVGFYGNQGDKFLTEDEPSGSGFLASVCERWEKSSQKASDFGIRVVHLRQGLVLGPKGGILQKLLPLYKMCLGGMIGSGKQYISWIHISDLERIISFLLENPLEGPINCCSPYPVQQKEFAFSLCKALHRSALLPLPSPLVKLFLGQMGKEMLLFSIRAYPSVLLKNGFQFQFVDLDRAVQDIIK